MGISVYEMYCMCLELMHKQPEPVQNACHVIQNCVNTTLPKI